MRYPVIRAARLAWMVAAVAGPAAAQPLPGLENFTIERPAPPPVVTPSPTPSATPAAPAPSPTPTPTPTSPTPTAPPGATATPVPTSRPTAAAPTPVATATPGETPAATATLTPPPATDDDAARVLTPAPSASTTPPGPAGAAWPIWLLGAVGLVVLGAGAWWLLGRRRDEEATEPAEVAPDVVAVPVSAPVVVPPPPLGSPPPPPAPAPSLPGGLVTTAAPPARPPGGLVTTALKPEVTFELIPIRAGIDTLRATLEFSLTIGNRGRAPAHDAMVEAWLLAADRDPRGVIAQLLARDAGETILPPFTLPAGAAIDVSGQVATPRDQLATITAGERKLFVPMLVVRALWHDGRGRRDGAGAAFMVGVPRQGQDRLAPLPLDRGARGYTTLAALRFEN